MGPSCHKHAPLLLFLLLAATARLAEGAGTSHQSWQPRAGVFSSGQSPLMRLGAAHDLLVNQQDVQAAPEQKLAALVQAHPVLVLQFALSLYVALNFFLERYSPSLSQVMRLQALICSFLLHLIDCIMSMRVTGDAVLVPPPEPTDATPASPGATDSLAATLDKTPQLRRITQLASIPVTPTLLALARSDMTKLSQTRSGQQAAYALLALSCGAPRHCLLPIVIRGSAFLVRFLVLLIVGVAPVPESVVAMVRGPGSASDVKAQEQDKGKGKEKGGKSSKSSKRSRGGKGGKGKRRKDASQAGPGLQEALRWLFPFPLASESALDKPSSSSIPDREKSSVSSTHGIDSSLHPETLDIVLDIASFPIEFLVTRGWSRSPRPAPVNKATAPPAGTGAAGGGTGAAAAAAAAARAKNGPASASTTAPTAAATPQAKSSTINIILQFLSSMIKGTIVMAILKARMRSIIEFIDPGAEPATDAATAETTTAATTPEGDDLSTQAAPAPAASSSSQAGEQTSPSAALHAPFFMSCWPVFRAPAARSMLFLVKQMLSPEGVTRMPGAAPEAEAGAEEGLSAAGESEGQSEGEAAVAGSIADKEKVGKAVDSGRMKGAKGAAKGKTAAGKGKGKGKKRPAPISAASSQAAVTAPEGMEASTAPVLAAESDPVPAPSGTKGDSP